MKKLFALLAVVLAVVSCQKDADLDVNVGGEQLVNITVGLPEATRAASGTGFDLTTLEANGLELRYILEIYVEDTNAVNDQKRIRKEAYTTATSDVVFPVRLVAGQNRNYRIVAWADIVPADANRTEDGDYDYYYETSEGLDQILINEAKWTAMKEQRDAYTAYQVVNNFTANTAINLTLTRPFAKVRVVSTDIKDIEDLGYELKNGTVEYSVDLNRQFNALYGTASNARAKAHTFDYPTVYALSNDAYETETQRTLFADYIFVDNIAEQDAVQFTMSVYENGGLLKTTTFNTDIALHANTLTTIIGEVLTEGGYVNIEINGELNEVNKYTVVSSASHLLKVINAGGEYILGNNIVVTTADLNEFKPIITRGNNETKTTIINLNGYTITVENDDADNAVVLEDDNTLIFAGEGNIVNQGTGALVNNNNANVVVTGGATVAEGTTTKAVLTGLAALKHVCANGGEFTFAENLTSSEILSITADNVVINGNGFAFTSNAPRAINVDGADGVVIKNLNIVASGERAINLINGGTNVTVENVTAKAANYTFNVAGSSAGAVAIIKNSDLTGLNTVNIAAENTNVTITNTKLTTVDNTEVENYATIAVNKYAEGSKVAVNGGEVVITGTHCDGCNVASVGSDNSEVTFDGTVGATNDDVVIIYFATIYSDGTYYGHATLDEAIAQSEEDNGSVITLIRNYTTSEPLIIANDKSVTLDLNGKTISSVDKNVEMSSKGNFYLIDNRGTLTIKDSSADKTGAIILSAETDREWTASSVVVANNYGNLTIEGGRIEHLGGTSMAYGVDNLTNGNLGEATCTINGGHIKSTYRAVRQFLNSATDMNILTVNGGIIEGANKSIWMQDPSKNANTGKLTVTEDATLNGDVYLYVTAGSTEWPVEVSIAASAVNGEVLTGNVPEGYGVVLDENGNWVVESYTKVTDGLFKDDKGAYFVTNAEGLATLNAKMANGTAGKGIVVNINADIDFTGKTWTPVDSHADSNFTFTELNGNGYTLSNLTINGQAMFTRFAGTGDVVIKDITFDNATVNSKGKINTSILTVQSYQNVLLDNVDVKNSSITGGYKVAPLIATVYNENPSTVTATLKNCDVENTTVKATSYDFCTTGMVAFVYAGDNDAIIFENCTVSNVKLYAPNVNTAHAAVYTTGSETLYNEVEGVTVTNVTFENI